MFHLGQEVVQLTPTVTTGTILLIITMIGTAAATAIPIYFKLKFIWLTQQDNLEKRLRAYFDAQTAEQTARLEECIHKLPGHPENPENQALPPSTGV